MLKKFLLPFLIAGLFVACNNGSSNGSKNGGTSEATPGCDLKVQVEGLNTGFLKLIGWYGQGNFLVDSAQVDASGLANFKSDTLYRTGLYYVLMPDKRNYFTLLLDKDQHLTMKTKLADLTNSMAVEGSLDNELYYKNLQWQAQWQPTFDKANGDLKAAKEAGQPTDALQKQVDELAAKRKAHIDEFARDYPNSFFTIFKMAGQNPDIEWPEKANGEKDTVGYVYQYRTQFWNNVPFDNASILRTPVYFNKLKRFMTELTNKQPDSLVASAEYIMQKAQQNRELFKFTANWIGSTYKYGETTVMGGEAVFVHVVNKYFTYENAFLADSNTIRDLRKKAVEVGSSLMGVTGQNLTATNLQGQKESLYDIKTPFKVLFIWSADCEHCQEEAPLLEDLWKKWKSRGVFEIFALNTDQDEAKWRNFVTKEGLTSWHHVFDPKYESEYYRKYHVDITPEVYLLDPNNKIVAMNLNPNQIEDVLLREMKKVGL